MSLSCHLSNYQPHRITSSLSRHPSQHALLEIQSTFGIIFDRSHIGAIFFSRTSLLWNKLGTHLWSPGSLSPLAIQAQVIMEDRRCLIFIQGRDPMPCLKGGDKILKSRRFMLIHGDSYLSIRWHPTCA